MFGIEVIVFLMFVRVILPLGLILWLGEWMRQRETHYWFR
jgi:hypothetical protein